MMTTEEYHRCGAVVSVAYSCANSAGYSDEFHVAFKHFQYLKNLILNILKEKSLALWALFSLKPYKAFTIT